jgi:hypothetical protein
MDRGDNRLKPSQAGRFFGKSDNFVVFANAKHIAYLKPVESCACAAFEIPAHVQDLVLSFDALSTETARSKTPAGVNTLE